ncbi:hypothetical protein BLNAU_16982 [Blattamonas nauphoetae]|uniref:Uncharacterized protein n=1 Tax=Blattamonas nauphoetae TaxID=2049346 RepID=A0ABQ9X8U6_9EUKA|nr:hypothetical protein BLNAU_16982 [Blattamonas nauphoetae]
MEADRTAQLMPLKSKRDLVSSERTEGLHLSPKVSRSRSVDLEDSPSMNYMRTLDILSISRSDLTKMKFGDCAEDGWGDGNENENGMGNGADVSVSNDVCEIGSHSTNDVLPTLGKDEEGWSGAETGPKLFSERTVQFVVPSLSEEARIASAEVGHLKPEFAVLPNFFSQSSPEMGQNSLGTDISKSTSMSEPLLDVRMRTTRDAAEQLPPAPSILTTPPTKMSSGPSADEFSPQFSGKLQQEALPMTFVGQVGCRGNKDRDRDGDGERTKSRDKWEGEKGGESEGQVVSFTKVEVEKEDDEAVNELMKMIGLWREWLEKKKGVSLVDLVVSSQEECGRRIEVDVARSKRRLRRQQRKQNRSRSSRRTQRASVVPRVPLNDLSRGLELLLTELEEETPQATIVRDASFVAERSDDEDRSDNRLDGRLAMQEANKTFWNETIFFWKRWKSNRVKYSQYGSESENAEAFRDMSVPLLSSSTDMGGENQYFCSECSSKVDAIRYSVLLSVPPFLRLALMRFSYDWERESRVKKGKEHVFVGKKVKSSAPLLSLDFFNKNWMAKEARRWADKSKDRISPTSTEEESIAEQLNRVKASLTIPPTHVTLPSDLMLFATHASDVLSASLSGRHAKETREKQTKKLSADPEHVEEREEESDHQPQEPIVPHRHLTHPSRFCVNQASFSIQDITARSMLTYSSIASASSTSFPVPRTINSLFVLSPELPLLESDCCVGSLLDHPPTLVVLLPTMDTTHWPSVLCDCSFHHLALRLSSDVKSLNKTHSPTDLLLVPSSSSCHPILLVDSLTTITFVHQSAFSSLNSSFADVERIPRLFTTRLEEVFSSFEILSQSPHTKTESRKKKACFIDIAEVAFQSEIDGIHQNQNRADFQLGVDLGRVLRNVILVETAEQETENNEVGHSSSSIVVHCTLTVSALVLPLFCHVSFGNIVVSLQNCIMTTDEHSTSALSLALTVQGVEVSASRADHHIPIFSVEKNVHSSLTPPQPKDPSSGPSFNQPHLSLVQTNPRLAATPICFILAKQDRTDRRSGVLQKHLLLSGLIKYVELLFLPAGFVVFDRV